MTSSENILLVGCGKMGGALMDGWIAQGTPPQKIFVVDPTQPYLPSDVMGGAGFEDIPDGFAPGVAVLAVKPQVMDDVLAPYTALVRPETVFLSIAAGRTIASFEGVLGEAARVVRAMPNTPAAVGRAITVLVANAHATDEQRGACETLMAAVGEVAWADDEALIDAVTGVSGSGPAYVFHLVEAMAAAGVAAGLAPNLAMQLARQTVAGSGELLFRSADPAATLRENVTRRGGTAAAALEVLIADDGMNPLMNEAIAAATRRSRELAS